MRINIHISLLWTTRSVREDERISSLFHEIVAWVVYLHICRVIGISLSAQCRSASISWSFSPFSTWINWKIRCYRILHAYYRLDTLDFVEICGVLPHSIVNNFGFGIDDKKMCIYGHFNSHRRVHIAFSLPISMYFACHNCEIWQNIPNNHVLFCHRQALYCPFSIRETALTAIFLFSIKCCRIVHAGFTMNSPLFSVFRDEILETCDKTCSSPLIHREMIHAAR